MAKGNQDWMRGIEWSPWNDFAVLMMLNWEAVWYSQERRRKGSWICCDRRQEKEVWNG